MIESYNRKAPEAYKRDTCRLCFHSNLQLLFSLAPTPPAEWFFKGEDRKATEIFFPLDLYFCDSCKHVQLLDVLDPKELFSNYFYESKTSPGLLDHFSRYASAVAENCSIAPDSLVVDIGSNDGTLLNNFRQLGFRVVGIEPSKALAEKCNSDGLKTYNSFLNSEVVEKILQHEGSATLVTANNVFAHNDDLHGMATCINMLLREGGVFVFEVSSILHTMKGMVIDYIYHEHLSYHSLVSLMPFLQQYSLQIFDVQVIDTKGGSYRVYAQKNPNPVAKSKRLIEALDIEISSGLEKPDFYRSVYDKVQREKSELHRYLKTIPVASVVAGYGASATSTTLTYEFDLNHTIEFLVDDNPIRHDSFLPGTNIKVYKPDFLKTKTPTHVIILAWRFSHMIIGKLMQDLPAGITIITPLPELKIIRSGE